MDCLGESSVLPISTPERSVMQTTRAREALLLRRNILAGAFAKSCAKTEPAQNFTTRDRWTLGSCPRSCRLSSGSAVPSAGGDSEAACGIAPRVTSGRVSSSRARSAGSTSQSFLLTTNSGVASGRRRGRGSTRLCGWRRVFPKIRALCVARRAASPTGSWTVSDTRAVSAAGVAARASVASTPTRGSARGCCARTRCPRT